MVFRAVCSILVLAAFCSSIAAKVSNRVEIQLNRDVVPAIQQGDSVAIVKSLAKLTGKMKDAKVEAVDEWLEAKGLPNVGTLLVHHRLRVITANGGKGLPKPTRRELLLLIPALRKLIPEIHETGKQHPVLTGKLPPLKKFDDYEKAFWDMHVAYNELGTGILAAQYGMQLSNLAKLISGKALSPEQKEVLATDFKKHGQQVMSLGTQLARREAELRLQRFHYAEKQLSPLAGFMDQIHAVDALQTDGRLLFEYLKKNPSPDPDTTELELASYIKKRVDEAIKANPQLAHQAQLLFGALHYWLRGRYGAGTDGHGLLKGASAQHSREASFALFMPKETPKPSDPLTSNNPVPQFERRHHYHWCFEEREIQFTSSTRSQRFDYELESTYFY